MTTTEQSPELSIVMPAYNEAANIASVLESTTRHMERSGIRYEINVVDDGSDDGTGRLLEKMAQRQPRLRIVRHDVNLGYGAAIRSGLEASRGQHILVSDGDGQFSIEDLGPLWDRREQADMVLGYRAPRHDPPVRRFAGWMYSRVLVRLTLGGRFRDVNCGFKLISRPVIDGMKLESTGALISAELLTRARLSGARFVEVGVRHFPRRYGKATGLLPQVVIRMFGELMRLRRNIMRASRKRRGSGLRPDCDAVESASV